MSERLDSMLRRHGELSKLIQDPDIVKDQNQYRSIMKEYSQLNEIAEYNGEVEGLAGQLEETRTLAQDEKDPEMKELAKEELKELELKMKDAEDRLKFLLIPRDPLDEKNIIMEIRAGTGGEEAALFAADLFRMYSRFAETRGWKFEIMNSNETELGGLKEIVFSISGKNVYENMRYESGVHRVQRVPATEASGRIHTSAVTVAVLPEADETEIDIKQEDLRIDVMRAGGPGGQCVNTTDSAVRITHIPSGLVVHCQDEKSQIKNKAKAMRVLRARIYEMEEAKAASERAEARKSQVGTGDRSERIRTYNFPQNRLTDHRINLTLYKLDLIMQGDVEELFDALKLSAREELLRATAS
ncbi:peptide chain release factor 1 [Leadbettera azotonutricia]|uniref:Peptide chain release factor 1 n=1 Tax=Leadbettera azotonutricia (strain ATCC BAA-888 / DSM 13862 / ZAS-9) TaxID=545695 RepID=F5YDT2_LEAAZ|nr:peptide chain release factor 1 [Leadbettera azotonutricia]AEF81515.1 peptide chain release factor 1 [Leadbettera azotonutricia ZAS-9]